MAPLPEHLMPGPAGRSPLPRTVMAEHQRERVLEAAIGVFAKRGYQETTIDHIVAAARIGVGKFYELFDGKEDCFLQAYDRIVAAARDRIATAISSEAAWPEQVLAVLRTLLELIAEQPLQARIALAEVQTAGPAALARYEQTLAGTANLLREGRAIGGIAAELPPTFEDAIAGGLAWLLQQRVVSGEPVSQEELLPELVELVLEPYVGERQAARLLASASGVSAG
ncbi:MAG TPA: TetR/AcrR family transcriptional regulator [Solirubrobacterales bacterium]|nr:TetR/AcrR family transcriptional regulator [Solirubrobacterales bacterium]